MTVEGGRSSRLTIELVRLPEPADYSPWTWVTLSAGAAGFVAGTTTYLLGDADHRTVADADPTKMTRRRALELEASGDRKKLAGYVLWGIGGANPATEWLTPVLSDGRLDRRMHCGHCGGVLCPDLGGYTAQCNEQRHCEYTNADSTDWRAYDVWIWVPPGSFELGSPYWESGAAGETPQHEVASAAGFFVAKYEVVVAAYEACEAAAACSAPSTADWDGYGWGTNRSSNGRGTHPQNGLTWQQAQEICVWLGGRLPSEAEWEYAAKGPVHRTYPWGNTPGPTCANERAVMKGCGTEGSWPVGSKSAGASHCGALDMAGNLWEWVEDWYHSDYNEAPADGSAWVSPAGTHRVKRGGSFSNGAGLLRSASRSHGPPTDRFARHGARCVRGPEP